MPDTLSLRSGAEIPYENAKVECASKGLYAVLLRRVKGKWEQRPFRHNPRLMQALDIQRRVVSKQLDILKTVREAVA